jgi:LmbE family N-acetylglucosaminyl deacetylase
MTASLDSDSRLMLIAPHPDDEALACSIILQRATRAGAAIRVIYATDGDDNPWPQRVLERKWRLKAADRKRWGKLRRSEALAALRVLGVKASQARFLGLPDQGLTDLLRRDCRSTVERFAQIIAEWSPTHLLVPSVADTHPDHSALAVMLQFALADLPKSRMSVWSYAVHGKSPAFFDRAQQHRQSQAETATKLLAIRCHKTQIKLSRRRFLGYATRPERLLNLGSDQAMIADGSIREILRQPHMLRLKIGLSAKLIRTRDPALFVLGRDSEGAPCCLKTRLPVRSCNIEMSEYFSDQHRATARYHGNAFAGEFTIPINIFSPAGKVFVKVERRSLFFDEAGWLEIPAIVHSRPAASLTPAEPSLAIR